MPKNPSYLSRIRSSYVNAIMRNCASCTNERDLNFWRDNLFATTIVYILPFCLIALVPGLWYTIKTKQYTVAVVDILTAIAILLIAFVKGIPILNRKIIFISIFYLLGFLLLFYVGPGASGLLYLLSASIFSILIFSVKFAFYAPFMNVLVCLLYAVLLHYNVPPLRPHRMEVNEFFAVATNLFFLSFLCAALIPKLVNGLQDTILKEKQLRLELHDQQMAKEETLILLEQKNKELEQFAYVASHDLNEPLRMVTSFMGLLKRKYDGSLDEKAHRYIDFAVDGGRRMQRLIADLLQLSRTARKDKPKEPVNLGAVLETVKQNISQLVQESNAEIIIATPLPELNVYLGDISSLFQNLLTNAIKFRRPEVRPIIRISAEEKEDEWVMAIQDNGIGISPEKSEKIFEIFVRLNAQEIYDGSGIGLAIAKKIVEQHGGKIWLVSEEGNGSTFYFSLKK